MTLSDAAAASRPPVCRAAVLGVRIDCFRSLEAFVTALGGGPGGGGPGGDGPTLVTFVNPAAVRKVRRDPAYAGALARFDHVLPDGIGVSVAARWLGCPPAARISFDSTSLAPAVLAAAAARGLSVALIGGAPGATERAAEVLRTAVPGLRVTTTLDGYGTPAARTRELLQAAPDVVICGMGTGYQERFLLGLAARGWRGWGFTCGGYFDQLAGGVEYYPRWVDAAHLRWAYRLCREPRRLWRRYLVDYGEFLARLGLAVAARPDRALGAIVIGPLRAAAAGRRA